MNQSLEMTRRGRLENGDHEIVILKPSRAGARARLVFGNGNGWPMQLLCWSFQGGMVLMGRFRTLLMSSVTSGTLVCVGGALLLAPMLMEKRGFSVEFGFTF